MFHTVLVPKSQELIASPFKFDGNREKANLFFEQGLLKTFSKVSQIQNSDYPLTVFYAFKQSESDNQEDDENQQSNIASTGWETMLEGLVRSGFSVTGTWPVRTEFNCSPKGIG